MTPVVRVPRGTKVSKTNSLPSLFARTTPNLHLSLCCRIVYFVLPLKKKTKTKNKKRRSRSWFIRFIFGTNKGIKKCPPCCFAALRPWFLWMPCDIVGDGVECQWERGVAISLRFFFFLAAGYMATNKRREKRHPLERRRVSCCLMGSRGCYFFNPGEGKERRCFSTIRIISYNSVKWV